VHLSRCAFTLFARADFRLLSLVGVSCVSKFTRERLEGAARGVAPPELIDCRVAE